MDTHIHTHTQKLNTFTVRVALVMDARPAARQDSLGSALGLHNPNPLAGAVTSVTLPAQQTHRHTHEHRRLDQRRVCL